MCGAGVLRHDGPERLPNLQRGPGTETAGSDPGIQPTCRADFGSTLGCHTNTTLHFPAPIKDALAASSLQIFLTRKLVESQNHTSEVTDQRIRVTSEVLTSIKLIKMYSWEKPFTKVIKGTGYLAFCSEPGMSWWTESFTFWGFFHVLGLDLCSWENVLVIHFRLFEFSRSQKKGNKALGEVWVYPEPEHSHLVPSPLLMCGIAVPLPHRLTIETHNFSSKCWGTLFAPSY